MPQSRQKRLVRSSPSLELQEVTNKLLTALGAEDVDVAESFAASSSLWRRRM
jgi:hypothetical protein